MKKFISWRRVSTKRQGISGLGLQAQSSIIDYFVKSENGELIADYEEVYTGKDLQGCKELQKAKEHCKRLNATLIIAKTDRFRTVIEALQIFEEMRGDIYFCDLPHTDKFTLTLFFALAEREALIVSIRTKAALAAKKAQGYKLGNGKGVDLSKANEASAQARRDKAKNDPNNKIIWGVVGLNGTPTSDDLQRMTIQLNQMGVKSASGMEFTPERLRSTYHNLKRIYR